MRKIVDSSHGMGRSRGERRSDAIGLAAIVAIAGALAAVTASQCHGNFTGGGIEMSLLPSILFGIVTWFWWAGIAIGLWWMGKKKPELLRFTPVTVVLQLAAATLMCAAHVVLLQWTLDASGERWPAWGKLYSGMNFVTPARFGLELVLYGCVYGLSGLLSSQAQARWAMVQKLELERQLSQAQLKALQMQLEPHFLFNTLNALASLIAQERNREAASTLSHLNTILRTTLQRKAPEKVPFAEELRVIESYLAIQQVRFADRLQVKIDASPEALEGLVPCFLLQPIVENAIQHGIAPMEEGGVIETRVKRMGDKLWMQVRDNGRGVGDISLTQGHGIGERNTKERLAYFYPDAYKFEAVSPSGGGYEVTIQIPYERAVA
jgi:two-component sensor histidine kinase